VVIDAKAHRWTVKGLFFGVLLGMLAILVVPPAQAQETSYDLDRIKAKKQIVEVLDAEGNSLGYGEFRTQIAISRDGRISGKVQLDMPAVTVQFNPTDFTIEKGSPWEVIEVVLNGRFEVTAEGHTQSSTGTVTIKEVITSDPTSSSDWGSPNVMGYDFLADSAEAIDGITLAAVTELPVR
jgi:hypothetical protein